MIHVGFYRRGTGRVCPEGRLSSNPFAWNRRAHILFIDQPRYVGYSTGSGPFVLSSKDAAADLVQFIRGCFWDGLILDLKTYELRLHGLVII